MSAQHQLFVDALIVSLLMAVTVVSNSNYF